MSAFDDRRVRRIKLAPEFIARILAGDWIDVRTHVLTDVPVDAKVHHVYADPHTPAIIVVVSSETWDPVPANEIIPEFMPTIKIVTPDVDAKLS